MTIREESLYFHRFMANEPPMVDWADSSSDREESWVLRVIGGFAYDLMSS